MAWTMLNLFRHARVSSTNPVGKWVSHTFGFPISGRTGDDARSKVYLSKVYFCEMYPTCLSSKLCEFI